MTIARIALLLLSDGRLAPDLQHPSSRFRKPLPARSSRDSAANCKAIRRLPPRGHRPAGRALDFLPDTSEERRHNPDARPNVFRTSAPQDRDRIDPAGRGSLPGRGEPPLDWEFAESLGRVPGQFSEGAAQPV